MMPERAQEFEIVEPPRDGLRAEQEKNAGNAERERAQLARAEALEPGGDAEAEHGDGRQARR